jgi:hypothetical protein
MTVDETLQASNNTYLLYAFKDDGNGEVNGYDFTNIAATAIGVLHTNETPPVDSIVYLDVTVAFNRAISNDFSYFGLHTRQAPEITGGSHLER